MKEEIKIRIDGKKLEIVKIYEFTDIHKAALKYLVKNHMYEFRGKAEREEMDVYHELEVMGLAEDVEEAWHPSWVLSDEGEKIAASIPVDEVIIKDDAPLDHWCGGHRGQTFKVKSAFGGELNYIEGFAGLGPNEAYLITEGKFKGYAIKADHCTPQ